MKDKERLSRQRRTMVDYKSLRRNNKYVQCGNPELDPEIDKGC